MEVELNSKGPSNGVVTISSTSFSVNDEPDDLLDVEELDLELPETAFRSRHHHLLNALASDDSDDFEDIQFFHRSTQLQQQLKYQQQQVNNLFQENGEFSVVDVSNLSITGSYKGCSNNSSENPFVFPDNVMEYGEPQFFPGNCVGYLETILEETDEEYEEEEGCSGRHWWTADSDTDTDSVIRVDNNTNNQTATNPFSSFAAFTKDFVAENSQVTVTNTGTPNNVPHNNNKNTFRTSASSRPFEMEDLHLLDQLDLAFEETLMEPRRRAGIASEKQKQLLESAIVDTKQEQQQQILISDKSIEIESVDEKIIKNVEEEEQEPEQANNRKSESSEEDEQPAEVNEEDFFYTTSEESDASEENSEEATSSDDGKNEGVVLAEFSLNSSFNGAMTNRYRRSFEGNSKLRSFRSFDSLNCLAGTELLFSKADTFPSFHYIKEVAEPSSTCNVEGGRDRKNSDSSAEQLSGSGERPTEMSTENLSEDSGIGGDGAGTGSALNLNSPHLNSLSSTSSSSGGGANEPSSLSYIAKPEFALNPFVFSSASTSEENSMSSSLYPIQDGIIREHLSVQSTQIQQDPHQQQQQQPSQKEGRANPVTVCTNNKDTGEHIKIDNGPPAEGKECQRSHPVVYQERIVETISNLASTELTGTELTSTELTSAELTIITRREFSSKELTSEPDVVAQCNMNGKESYSSGSDGSGSSTDSSSEDDNDIKPQAKPCAAIERIEGLPQLASEHHHEAPSIPLQYALDLPTPNSEVLLKFTDEDEIIQRGKNASESEFQQGDNEEEDAEDNAYNEGDNAEEEEDEEEVVDTDEDETEEPTIIMRSKVYSTIPPPSMITMNRAVEGENEAGMESGPMSTLSSTTQTSLPLQTTDLPSLAHQNDNSVLPVSSGAETGAEALSTPNEESLLFDESELPPPRGLAFSTPPFTRNCVSNEQKHQDQQQQHQQHQQEQEQQQHPFADSVAVQKSSWSDVVHHQPPLLPQFISGSSKFGGTDQSLLLESNLDLEACESLAPTEHLCNSSSRRNSVEKVCSLDNGISTRLGSRNEHKNEQSPHTLLDRIEKPGSNLIISPPRALEGEQCCTNESLIKPVKPTVISTATIVPTATVVPTTSTSSPSTPPPSLPSYVPDLVSLSDPVDLLPSREPATMEVVERPSNVSVSSSSSSVVPIRTKTYGARNEVEVFLVSSRTPSPSPIIKPADREASPVSPSTETKAIKKEVHFCPVVSEISWRESYTDQGSENSGSSENLLESPSAKDIIVKDAAKELSHKDRTDEIKQFVKVSEQVTQPLENVVLLSKNSREMTSSAENNNEHEIMSRHSHIQQHHTSEPSTNGNNVYEDVVDCGDLDSSTHPELNAKQQQQPSTLSMVPDLLSQCENIPQTHTHINVNIQEQQQPSTQALPTQVQQQHTTITTTTNVPQQQIFPSMFAEKNDTKNGGGKSNKKSKALATTTTTVTNTTTTNLPTNINKKNDKEKSREVTKDEGMIIKDKDKSKQSKPGFFERLSKIRLSGSKNKKKKIHPKEKEALQEKSLTNPELPGPTITTPIVTSNLKSNSSSKSPILKKYPANAPTPVNPSLSLLPHSSDAEADDEADNSHEAFENILQDIAGINAIKLRQQQQQLEERVSPRQETKQLRSFAERKQFFVNPVSATDPHERAGSPLLDSKLSQFVEDTTRTRDQISKSHPDLEVIEGVVRDSITIETKVKEREHHTLPSSKRTGSNGDKSSPEQHAGEGERGAVEPKNEREWYKLLKSAAEKYYYRGDKDKAKNFKTGIVETDLDTGASREMLNVDSELVIHDNNKVPSPPSTVKTQSLTNLSSTMPLSLPPHHTTQDLGMEEHLLPPQGDLSDSDERAKSMEFLLDGNHKSSSVPPENQLRLECRQLSEHELRIQRSLQKLDVPEWYKKHNHSGPAAPQETLPPKPTDVKLNKRSDYGSASGLAGGWAGLSAYKTSSLSSLQNQGRYNGINRSNFVRGRPATMSSVTRSSRESLLSPSSTASQSPSAFERCSFTYGMPFTLTRFSHGRLSTGSASISPPSTPVNPIGPTYIKKPYLGWRSQERLSNAANAAGTTTNNANNPTNSPGSSSNLRLSLYRPPAERLAAEILSARNRTNKPIDRPALPRPPPRGEKTVLTNRNPEMVRVSSPAPNVHDSIRQVTEQINQFVHHGDEELSVEEEEPPRPRPRQKPGKRPTVWIESSFVGCKPASN